MFQLWLLLCSVELAGRVYVVVVVVVTRWDEVEELGYSDDPAPVLEVSVSVRVTVDVSRVVSVDTVLIREEAVP